MKIQVPVQTIEFPIMGRCRFSADTLPGDILEHHGYRVVHDTLHVQTTKVFKEPGGEMTVEDYLDVIDALCRNMFEYRKPDEDQEPDEDHGPY